MEKGKAVCMGVDICKDKLEVAITGVKNIMQVKNDSAGIQKIIRLAKKRSISLICFEATGGYEMDLWQGLTEAGLKAAPVNPRLVRHFAQSANKLAKTDTIDAHVIAEFAYHMKPRVKVVTKEAELYEHAARRNRLLQMLVAEKNRSKKVRHGTVHAAILTHIAWLEKELEDLDKTIRKLIETDSEWSEKDKLLQSTPGVAGRLASCLIAQLPELGSLNRRQIAALVGVAPLNRDSGKFRGKRTIWGGRRSIRPILYMATLSSTVNNQVIRSFYLRLLENGKAKKTAIVACMRKLLTILNAMMKHREAWDVARNKVHAVTVSLVLH